MKEPTTSSFGSMLQRFRKRQKLSQHMLAERVGRSRESISLWERGLEYPDTFGIMSALTKELLLDEEEKRLFFEARYGTPAILPFHNLPFEKNPYFTGREALLEVLHQWLIEGKDVAIRQAVSGLGGVGKTQIALEYAYRYQASYHDILWAEAGSYDVLTTAYVNIARLLLLPERNRRDQNVIIAAVKRWLSTHKEWLLILDNIEDLSLIGNFVPAVRRGVVLLTTQRQVTGSVAQTIEVEMMPEEEGALFLLKRAHYLELSAVLNQIFLDDGTTTTAKIISREVDGLPLALDQAGAYILETGCSLIDYLALYRQRRDELLQRRGSVYRDHPLSVTATFFLAFDRVAQKHAAAPDAIPEAMIREGAALLGDSLGHTVSDPFLFDQAVEALQAYSLLHRNPTSHMLSLHRLVQAVLRDQMSEEVQQEWITSCILLLDQTFRPPPRSSLFRRSSVWVTLQIGPDTSEESVTAQKQRAWCDQLSLHVQVILALSTVRPIGPTTAAASLFQKLADVLCDVSESEFGFGEAEPIYERVLQIREQTLGPDHPDMATALENLAELYSLKRRYVKAEPIYDRVLQIREQTLGPGHPDVATALEGLAWMYLDWGHQAALAGPLYSRALQIRDKALPPGHPGVEYWIPTLPNGEGPFPLRASRPNG
jgi:transcriptional regulator with XRE-family HTH domain